MIISKKRADELGLRVRAVDCANCDVAVRKHGKVLCPGLTVPVRKAEKRLEQCPALDEERLKMEMTDAEWDAYRHNRLLIGEELKSTIHELRFVLDDLDDDTLNQYKKMLVTPKVKKFFTKIIKEEKAKQDVETLVSVSFPVECIIKEKLQEIVLGGDSIV